MFENNEFTLDMEILKKNSYHLEELFRPLIFWVTSSVSVHLDDVTMKTQFMCTFCIWLLDYCYEQELRESPLCCG